MTTHLQTNSRTELLLRISIFWRGLFTLLSAGGAIALWTGTLAPESPLWQKILITVVLVTASILSGIAAVQISRRNHSGRMISLVVDYLVFVICVVAAMTIGEVFIGIDAFAETFTSGLPYLGIVILGYFLGVLDEYFPQKQLNSETSLKVASRWVMLGGFALFLLQVGAINGILYFISKLAQPAGIVSVIGIAISSFFLWAIGRSETAQALHVKTNHEQILNGWLFLSPNLLGFLIFFAGPLVLSFYFSFTDSDAFNTPSWVGFANYAKILNVRFAFLTSPDQLAREVVNIKIYDEVGRFILGDRGILFAAADKFFWLALRNTLTFVLFAVPLSVIPALVLSNVLNSKLPGMKFYRAIYFMPSIAAVVGISLVWQWLYNATVGYINYFITLGIEFWNNLFNLAVVDPKIQWVSDEKTALLAVVLIAAWQTMGFNTVLFLAGLQNIPGEL